MNNNDNDGAAATDDAGQPGVSSRHKDSLPAAVGNNKPRTESAVIDDKADVLRREQPVAAREDAVRLLEHAAGLREHAVALRENAVALREHAVRLRQATASSRELEIRTPATLQEASDDHMIMLQQANERLVIATIEAQELAEQIQTAKAQLESAKVVVDKANLAKSEFLSSMSHELRTPLNAILGFAQLLEAGSPPPTPAQSVRLKEIIKAGWYLLELINEILDLAVIESGRLSLSPEPVPLTDVMRDCQAMIESQAQQRGIRVNILPFDDIWIANADRTRVKQVLSNLLSNAIKYNREHGTVEVKCSASSPERIRISIKDSGAGLPPEKLAQLFQPFNRLGQEGGAEQGTGIGLVVTKRLVELMGGTIGVESTVGAGSEFWIDLIRDLRPQAAAVNTMTAERAAQAKKNAAARTLLYVEDNPANLMLVEHIIDDHPHVRMLSAGDGALGIALARAHLPDVILMDINLPGISGIQALKVLREDPLTAHIPVIALSAHAMLRDIETGLEAGFFRYLTKPIKVNEFVNALDDALKSSAMATVDAPATGKRR